MTYPQIRINRTKILHNTRHVVEECHSRGIEVAGVTKLFCGHPEIAAVFVSGGVDLLADSRISNLRRLASFNLPKMLLRTPMISQASEIVQWSDMALVSEPSTVGALSRESCLLKKTYGIILMIDLGDLREGIYHEDEIHKAVEAVLSFPFIHLKGIGTNLTCFGGVIPTKQHMETLIDIKEKIERQHQISIETISGGNGSTLSLFAENLLPNGINQLRLGSSLTMGIGLNDDPIAGLELDAFTIVAEITEVREKPSMPRGEIGLDAFGRKPAFKDRGLRLRALCALGRQDVQPDHLQPMTPGIEMLGASSDHLILDITEAEETIKVGDCISFLPTYGGVLSAMNASDVEKVIHD